MHWPYERHRSILNMEKPRSTSLRYRWEDSSKTVLSMAEYSKNPWFEDNIVSKKLTILQRDLLFHSVFSHYLFLKANPRLCNNGRNLPIPIVEIPMRPLGNDIAVSRIKNLFKSKVAHTYRILAIENPVLSRGNENTLSEIISDASSRKQRRLYQATCKRAYVMEYDDGEHGNELSLPHFRPSSLLLNIWTWLWALITDKFSALISYSKKKKLHKPERSIILARGLNKGLWVIQFAMSFLVRKPLQLNARRALTSLSSFSPLRSLLAQNKSQGLLGIPETHSPLSSISLLFPFGIMQRRWKSRGNTFQPSTLKRKRRIGFLARARSKTGSRVLQRRKAKGRWYLTY